MPRYAHLLPQAAHALLTLSTQRRIAFCESHRWIGYDGAMTIIGQLDDLIGRFPTSSPPNKVLILGNPGNGKSAILQRFAHSHPLQMRTDGTPILPVVRCTMPAKPTESSFLTSILMGLNIAHNQRAPVQRKLENVREMLPFVGARCLAIDDFEHVAQAGKAAPALLARIESLSSDLSLSIAAAATPEVLKAQGANEQLRAGYAPALLAPWKLDIQYRRLLASYESLLPLAEPSDLASRELAPRIHAMAGDTLGGTVRLLRAAARRAIETGTERIDAAVLESLACATPA